MEISHEIVICMGSSCFSRGNKNLISIIKHFLSENDIESNVNLKGSLCEGECSIGPNLEIDGRKYHSVTENKLIQILKEHLL